MLVSALVCFALTVIAALIGFTGLAPGAAQAAKIGFAVFAVLFLAICVAYAFSARRPPA